MPGPRAATTTGAAGRLRTTVCRDPEVFAALAPQWDRLYRRCPAATPFQTHAWLHSWWLSYGRRGRLRLVLVHREGTAGDVPSGDGPSGEGRDGRDGSIAPHGELVAVAPLMRTYRPLPALVPLGGAITDYADVLVDEAADAAGTVAAGGPAGGGGAVTAALAAGVRRAARGSVVDLREVRPGAAAERLYARWPGAKRRLPDSVCLELPGLPMDGLIARVGSSRGQRIRKALRALDAAGVEEHEVAPGEVPRAVEAMMRLHLAQWRGRGVTPEHERPRFAAHLARAGAAMAASGDAVVSEFRLGGEVVAVTFTVLSPGLSGGYLYGAHPSLREARSRSGAGIDVMTLLMRHGVRQAVEGGRPVLSLLRGTEGYKSHWRPERRVNGRVLLAGAGGGPVLRLRHAAARLRAAAAASPRVRALLHR